MRMMRSPGDSVLSPADSLVVDPYRNKQHWVEFNDDLLNDTPEGIELLERSESWSREGSSANLKKMTNAPYRRSSSMG